MDQQSALTPVEDFIDNSPPATSEATCTQGPSQDADSERSTQSDEFTLALEFSSQCTPEQSQGREAGGSTSLDLVSLRDAMPDADSPSPMPAKPPFPRRSVRIQKRKSTEDGEALATVRRKRSASKGSTPPSKKARRSRSKRHMK